MKKVCTLLVCVFFLGAGCGKIQHQTIPEASVNFTINPNDVTYSNLNHYGGYEYFTGGVAGIVVYRVDQAYFVAYDRACPYDWEHADSWLVVEPSGLTLIDEHCGSRFNILDGSVINGPSEYPLKAYRTMYDGVRLRIYN